MLSERLIDHFQNPRNVGDLEPPAVTVGVENPVCGDTLRVSVLFDAGRIVAARYRVRGCTASVAAGSVLTELLLTQPAVAIDADLIEQQLGGLPTLSKHAAVLCADAARLIRKAAQRTHYTERI